MIKKLAKYVGKYKYLAIATPLLVIVESVLELLLPNYMADIVNIGIKNQDNGYILKVGAIMAVIALAAIVIGIVSSKTAAVAGNGYGSNLRVAMYNKLLTFSFADVDRFSTASLVTRLTNDSRNIQHTFTMCLRMIFRAPALLMIALFFSIRLNARLALVYLFAIPVLAAVVFTIMLIAHHLFYIMQQKYDSLNLAIQENLISIRVVKSFVREEYENAKFKVVNDELKSASLRAVTRVMLMNPLTSIVVNATLIATYWFGGRLVGHGQMLDGDLLAFVTYLQQVMMSLMMFSMLFLQLTRAKACADRVIEVIDTVPDIEDDAAAADRYREALTDGSLAPVRGRVEFKDVKFKYLTTGIGEDVLRGISFTAEAGQTIGIVGGTGAGKSSMVNLIPRFYDVTSGQVLIDGKDVREYTIKQLRSSIGMVLQNNVLFSGTIRENMLWGNPDATDAEIETALKDAQAYDFVMSFPGGLDTKIRQGGVNVSGGQKQRLCIARAMLKNPSILILDDSTSAVDSDTEGRIRTTFETTLLNCTVFIIAQRISSVRSADKIIVLDDGRLMGFGSHDELLKTNDIYREINNSQQEGVFGVG